MEQLETRVAYLRGLAEGMDVKGSEGRILEEMIRVMDQMAKRMRELEERVDDQEAYLEALDEDLTDVEATYTAKRRTRRPRTRWPSNVRTARRRSSSTTTC
ncbi:CD1247 N-terminal domain-containing protein [Calditerricola satsumensis]|uniref:CD1247 N-terminal domain-containing protein n=1 Tax=Calditerricola satsumensis TaxID=373054 RepID=UPI0006CFA00D|nr:CD1247 N-terminal domain-containing protein [Calditerricola satsumensis]